MSDLGAPAAARETHAKRHLLTFAVEDYFHVVAFRKLIDASQWYRFERRVERNTRKALDLLDEFGVKATFFTLGCIAAAAEVAAWPALFASLGGFGGRCSFTPQIGRAHV